jgi:hypothetical protein
LSIFQLVKHHKINTALFFSQIEVPSEMLPAQAIKTDTCDTAASSPDSETSTQDLEMLKTKRGHVLAELLDTERVYVNELGSLIKVSINVGQQT